MEQEKRRLKYSEFIEEIVNEVKKEYTEPMEVRVYPVCKNNDTIYDGLVIINPHTNISPTIYLTPYFHRYLDGMSIEKIIEDVIKTYKENLPTEDFDISLFRDFDKAKKNIIMKLVNTDKNEELLKDVPNIPFYDLSIVFLVDVRTSMKELATILVHNEHMKLWGVTVEDLYELAKENTPKLLPPRLIDLHGIYEDITGEDLPFLEELDAKILTNHVKVHGASCITYPGLLTEIYNVLEDSFFIIPSSIHEVIIIPKSNVEEDYTLEGFSMMVMQVNKTELMDVEVLSNHAYLFDGEKLIWEQEEIETEK